VLQPKFKGYSKTWQECVGEPGRQRFRNQGCNRWESSRFCLAFEAFLATRWMGRVIRVAFEDECGFAAPFEEFTGKKTAMKVLGASRGVGRGGNFRGTYRREPLHGRVPQR
jgi:hypothetical protein